MPSDTCYVLSFAIIMLNTSLHNPNVRDKPPVERFISMNRGINEGGDLPEELLRVRIGLAWACVGDDVRVTASSHFSLCLPFVRVFPLPQNLYDSIKNEPFKIPEDDGNDLTHTFFNPDREGWLLKLGMCTQGLTFQNQRMMQHLISDKHKQQQHVTSTIWYPEHNYINIWYSYDC